MDLQIRDPQRFQVVPRTVRGDARVMDALWTADTLYTVSTGLTHKRTKRALRAPSCKGAPSKTGRKLSDNIHFKEYKF